MMTTLFFMGVGRRRVNLSCRLWGRTGFGVDLDRPTTPTGLRLFEVLTNGRWVEHEVSGLRLSIVATQPAELVWSMPTPTFDGPIPPTQRVVLVGDDWGGFADPLFDGPAQRIDLGDEPTSDYRASAAGPLPTLSSSPTVVPVQRFDHRPGFRRATRSALVRGRIDDAERIAGLVLLDRIDDEFRRLDRRVQLVTIASDGAIVPTAFADCQPMVTQVRYDFTTGSTLLWLDQPLLEAWGVSDAELLERLQETTMVDRDPQHECG